MASSRARWRRAGGFLAGITLATMGVMPVGTAAPAAADTAPVDPGEPETVSADALPTVQTDGVVWAQVVVGQRVYVTGEFTVARRAGSPPGHDETPRRNLLAFDIGTGELIESWAPSLDAQGTTIAASGDGAVIYVGGDFNRVDGQSRPHVAAIDAATGDVLAFNPVANVRVAALAVLGDTVFLGGHFTMVSYQPRYHLAAVDGATGALLPWAPVTNDAVVSMTAHAPSGRVVVGGNFAVVNGVVQPGMASIDGATGALMPWAANTVILNYGSNSYISGLTTDGEMIYGVGWNFGGAGGNGNFEGVFAADPLTGELDWVDGCRGDNYGITVQGEVLYTASHAHDCAMVGGHPQTDPLTFQRAQAFHKRRSPHGLYNAYGMPDTWRPFAGRPAADLLHWLPTIALGSYTGQYQGPWTVVSNDDYVVFGGEFPRVNGRDQYGLVRFARKDLAPNHDQIQSYDELLPSLTPLGPGTVRVGWTAAWDRDNRRLSVEVLRGETAATSTVLATFATDTDWWTRPPLGFVDTTAPPGTMQTYRIRVSDPFGNGFAGPPVTVTVPDGAPAASPYRSTVAADRPVHHWRLDEPGPLVARDWVGSSDLVVGAAAQRGTPGALLDEPDAATTWPGTFLTGVVQGAAGYWQAGPQTFSVEAWVRTTTTQGGKIIGFGDSRTGRSSSNGVDRHVYMTGDGRFVLGVRPDMGERRTVGSAPGYNDGRWHHVVGTLGAGGLQLYVDGAVAAQDVTVTAAQVYWGYWRIGGDRLTFWPGQPLREAIDASIDEVAVYSRVLSPARVRAHYRASGRPGSLPNDPPVARLATQVSDLDLSADGSASDDPDGRIVAHRWDFGDGATGTGPDVRHHYAAAGTYTVRLTVTDDSGATGEATAEVAVTEPPPEFAVDRFERSVTDGWGTADRGGGWTVTAPATAYAVGDGTGRMTGSVAANRAAYLTDVSQVDQDITVDLALDRPPTGGGAYASIIGRRVPGSSDYRVQLRYLPEGSVGVTLVRTDGGTAVPLGSLIVGGLTAVPGVPLHVRFQVGGTAVTTARAKVWPAGVVEPADWTVSHTGAPPPALQQPGHLGVLLYLSGSWTGPPATLSIDDLDAVP